MIAETTNTDVAIMSRMIEPHTDDLSPETARFFLALKFSDDDVARMHQLSGKANEGTLTSDEDAEMTEYERVGHLLGILQSKARTAIRDLDA